MNTDTNKIGFVAIEVTTQGQRRPQTINIQTHLLFLIYNITKFDFYLSSCLIYLYICK